MAGKVEVSQFTGAFAKLNGSTDITATRADIIRSLLTEGYLSRKKAMPHDCHRRASKRHARSSAGSPGSADLTAR
jgi:hypothetical protein